MSQPNITKKPKIELILDSGAFTAWTKDVKIDIDEYIDFAKEYEPKLAHIANLDVIPGKFGQKYLSTAEIEESASKGWENYQYLLKYLPADKVMHIFHQGEDFKWLHKLVDSGASYIGISPANDKTSPIRAEWLKECMKIVCDEDGVPKVKFHGYAATSFKLMSRFPWTSADSGSWKMMSIYGNLFIPSKIVYGDFDWSSPSKNFKITNHVKPESETRIFSMFAEKEKEGEKIVKEQDKAVYQVLRDYGFDPEGMRDDYMKRIEWNIFYYLRVQQEVGTKVVLAAMIKDMIPCLEKAMKTANLDRASLLFSYWYLFKGGQREAFDYYIEGGA